MARGGGNHEPVDKRIIIRKMLSIRGLLSVLGLNQLVNFALDMHVTHPFVYTLVECNATNLGKPVPPPPANATDQTAREYNNFPCGKGMMNVSGTCRVAPPHDKSWSQSGRCADKETVMNDGRTLSVKVMMAAHIGALFATLLLGPMADVWGRKPIIVLGTFGAFLKTGSSLAGAYLSRSQSLSLVTIVLGVGGAIASIINADKTAFSAMIADSSLQAGDERAQAADKIAGFACSGVLMQFVMWTAAFAGYYIARMHLEDYTTVWAGLTAASFGTFLMAAMVLKETLPPRNEPQKVVKDQRSSSLDRVDQYCRCGQLCRDLVSMTRKFSADKVLFQLLLLTFYTGISFSVDHMTNWYLQSYLNWTNEGLQAIGFVLPWITAVGSYIAAPISARMGAYRCMALGMFTQAFASLLVASIVLFHPHVGGIIFWISRVFEGIAKGLEHSVWNSICSQRVEPDKQAKLFTILGILRSVGAAVGGLIIAQHAFNAKWHGIQAGTGFYICSALHASAAIWMLWVYKRYLQAEDQTASGDYHELDAAQR